MSPLIIFFSISLRNKIISDKIWFEARRLWLSIRVLCTQQFFERILVFPLAPRSSLSSARSYGTSRRDGVESRQTRCTNVQCTNATSPSTYLSFSELNCFIYATSEILNSWKLIRTLIPIRTMLFESNSRNHTISLISG